MIVVDLLSALALLAGSLLALLAAVGLHRFPDVFCRMHAATKAGTLGLLLIVAGAAVQLPGLGNLINLAVVVVLQFLTSPAGAHMIGRAAYRAGGPLTPATHVDELADAGGVD